uniref:Iso2 n=1 Tax=Arundo donax TaxID=35708 RepID=A0A0A9FVD9_ARUDO
MRCLASLANGAELQLGQGQAPTLAIGEADGVPGKCGFVHQGQVEWAARKCRRYFLGVGCEGRALQASWCQRCFAGTCVSIPSGEGTLFPIPFLFADEFV